MCATNESLKDSFNSHQFIHKKINHYLYNKYSETKYSYNNICIDNLIYNEYCHVVARFKDYLIYDDDSEFLNEFCNKDNLKERLKYIFSFYSTYIRFYPNYLVIPEKKFLYKNLRKKQKVINENLEIKIKNREKRIYIKRNMTYQNIWKENISFEGNIFNDQSHLSNDINKNIIIKKYYFNSKSHYNTKKSKIIDGSLNSKNNYTERNDRNQNLKKYLYKNNNENNQNTQYSSILNLNNNEESKKSRASLTEIINLLSSSDNSRITKNNGAEINSKNNMNKCTYKLTKNNKNRIKFFRLENTDYIRKVFKSIKIKKNFIKSEIENISTSKNESKINKKNNYIKNYNPKSNLKRVDGNINAHKKTTSCMDCISKIFKNKSKNNKIKRKSSITKYKKNILYKINKAKQNQCLPQKTLPNFCKQNKINEIKKNISNNIKKILTKKNNKSKNWSNLNNLFFSTNSTINIENNNSNKNKVNGILRRSTEYQILNTAKNITKKNIYSKFIKSTKTKGYSVKTKKFKTKFKKVRLDSDSILSTQVSINKKFRHNSTCIENILSLIKKSVKKNKEIKNYNNRNYKNILSFPVKFIKAQKINLSEKNNSYEIKPFSSYYQKISYSTNKKGKQKERNSALRKNKNIINFFNSKDFYNLRINYIKHKKTKKSEKKNNISLNKNQDKNKVNKSLFLKSFNKGYIHINSFGINKNINKNLKMNHRNNYFEKNRKEYEHCDHISSETFENNNLVIRKHKKNNTENICKIFEEIEKKIESLNKIKTKENIDNNRLILNRIKTNKNRDLIHNKITTEILTKSFKIKSNNDFHNSYMQK